MSHAPLKKLERALLTVLAGALVATSTLVYEALRPPRRAVSCDELGALAPERYTLEWRCWSSQWEETSFELLDSPPGRARYQTSYLDRTVRYDTDAPAAINLAHTTDIHPDVREAYTRQHESGLFPDGQVYDVAFEGPDARGFGQVTLATPPRPLRFSTFFALFFAAACALGWLVVRAARRRWYEAPVSF